jgi:hypothetical protein
MAQIELLIRQTKVVLTAQAVMAGMYLLTI